MKKGLLVMLVLGIALFLAACGGGDSGNDDSGSSDSNGSEKTQENSGDSSEASGNSLDIAATNWKFDQDEYTVSAGEPVDISLTSKEGNHGLAIDKFDVNIKGEGKASFTPEEPGEYTMYCSVPCGKGHSDMKSTLVVE
ncbi:hypothetical protein GCM10028778_20470 [Barrientosiimonas marina]|uniref:Cytochrome C oxidase subunit II n=1 Tax=Lentibacillus kimchii TaxID=1542911 RepID=A0ABW2UXQ4_9BACI